MYNSYKPYVVYKQWHDSTLQQVLEYFTTYVEAVSFAKTLKKSDLYTIGIGVMK